MGAPTHPLVDLHAQGALGDVPHHTGLALVPLVGHALRGESGCSEDVGPAPHALKKKSCPSSEAVHGGTRTCSEAVSEQEDRQYASRHVVPCGWRH
eukprot:scaffold274784_cov17-Tisochrysis_lutea.AAC.1